MNSARSVKSSGIATRDSNVEMWILESLTMNGFNSLICPIVLSVTSEWRKPKDAII